MSVGLSASSYVAVERGWRTDARHSDFSRTDLAENVTKVRQSLCSMLGKDHGISELGKSLELWPLSRSWLRKIPNPGTGVILEMSRVDRYDRYVFWIGIHASGGR